MKHILIIVGDPSADRHGAALAEALKARRPGLKISALGGPALQKAADNFLFPLVAVGGFGFWEPLLKLPSFWKALQAIKSLLKSDPPDLVIPIDYYGFNIRAAGAAQAAGIPVVYYISPQVWASRPGRIRKLAAVVSKMLVIFPFELDLYRRANVPVVFVGHPLLDTIPAPSAPPPIMRIGLLPGSRQSVVIRHLPIVIAAANRLKEEFPNAEFLLFRPKEIDSSFYQEALAGASGIQLVQDSGYKQRRTLSLAISVSGTAALENTLLGIPMVIMYRLSPLTYAIARAIIKIPFIGIPNILAGRQIVPELIQGKATPDALASTAGRLLKNPNELGHMRQDLLQLRGALEGGGTARAADEILDGI